MTTDLILIVDDSLTVRMDLVEALEAAGYATRQAASAAEARLCLERDQISVIILDVILPDVDGIDFLAEVKSGSAADAPFVLLLSSEAEVRDRIRGMSVGADDYIGKPYDVNHVVARSRALLASRQGARLGGRPVLVIDDSRTFREQLRDALEAAAYSVVVAPSGEEGLRLAAVLRPQAILVDNAMPGLDGCSVIRQVRLDAALRTTPCVLLTASEGERVELNALDAGADAFVRKEDLEVVLARLAAVLRRTAEPEDAIGLASPKRVLAVDDSPTYLNTLAGVLQSEGYDVVLASSGDECIAMLAAQPIDCILLDLEMPGSDGLETCRRIKAAAGLREIPLVILTARQDRAAMIEALGSGADDFIPKSGDFEVLKARVRAQLRRKQFEDEHRHIRERLMSSELQAAEARAEREILRTRALLVEELEIKNAELTAAYSELQNTQQHLVQSAKMASLGELVAGVAHELNNPLAFVRSHLETIRRSLSQLDGLVRAQAAAGPLAAWSKAETRLQQVDRGLERMTELVVKLRTFSRLDEGEIKQVDLGDSIDSVLTILHHRCKGRITVTTDVAPPARLECYASLLNQAIMNLVANAIDAIDGQGTIVITTRHEDQHVVIRVADSGAGIPEHLRHRVLEPFFTTKAVGQGTGLGLSITYSIVRKHGGTIELLPRPEGGTEAVLRIPEQPLE